VLARGKTDIARCWTYVRDDRPFAGPAPPAAVFHYSRDRRGEHPTTHLQGWAGVLQADAYSGYAAQRQPAPVLEAACWALEAVQRIDALFEIECAITGQGADQHDGRICLTNNAAERALRGIALGRKSWLFAGSDRGGERAAFMYSLIVTAKLNDIDPQAWLADVLARIAEHPARQIDELLPWNWRAITPVRDVAA